LRRGQAANEVAGRLFQQSAIRSRHIATKHQDTNRTTHDCSDPEQSDPDHSVSTVASTPCIASGLATCRINIAIPCLAFVCPIVLATASAASAALDAMNTVSGKQITFAGS